jgi:glutamine synthetase
MPAAVRYLGQLLPAGVASRAAADLAARLGEKIDALGSAITKLEHAQHTAHETRSVQDEARAFVQEVIPAQAALREIADELETLVADDLWPLPKYRELLFQY